MSRQNIFLKSVIAIGAIALDFQVLHSAICLSGSQFAYFCEQSFHPTLPMKMQMQEDSRSGMCMRVSEAYGGSCNSNCIVVVHRNETRRVRRCCFE
jgi:hypothetical protein